MTVPIKQFETTRERVKKYLTYEHEMRDDLEWLTTKIWEEDMIQIEKTGVISLVFMFGDFLKHYREGKITPAETIRRTWQDLQRKHPELRGEKYAERHRVGSQVSETINN